MIKDQIKAYKPYFSFDSLDNCNHSLWVINEDSIVSKISNISIGDLFDYTDAFISIFLNDPIFEGQTKKRILTINFSCSPFVFFGST